MTEFAHYIELIHFALSSLTEDLDGVDFPIFDIQHLVNHFKSPLTKDGQASVFSSNQRVLRLSWQVLSIRETKRHSILLIISLMLCGAVAKIWEFSCELENPTAMDAYASHEKQRLVLLQMGESDSDLVKCRDHKRTTVEVVVDSEVVTVLIPWFVDMVGYFDI